MEYTQTSNNCTKSLLKQSIVSSMLALLMLMSASSMRAYGLLAREPTQRRTIVPITDFQTGRTINDPTQNSNNRIGTAMLERRSMMTKEFRLHFVFPDGRTVDPWILTFQDHPKWVRVDGSESSVYSVVDVDQMAADISASINRSFPPAQSCTITGLMTDQQKILRPTLDHAMCITQSGVLFNRQTLKQSIITALTNNASDITVAFTADEPVIHSTTGAMPSTLSLVATGRSNFKGSDANRIFNVRKALSEKVHNIVVPAGATFSFNTMLGDLSGNGWRMGLGIFENGQLKPTLGGGICQSSTTLYRAVLQAGLPVLAHKSHSLFVHYYEQYGIGQDVTVYSGSQDFSFRNDFTTPIVIQAETNGFDAYVRIFAVPDGRSVTLTGPYFAKNAPVDLKVNNRAVRSNEIVWQRSVAYADGTQTTDQLVSRYKYLLHSVADAWIAQHPVVESTTQLLAKY